MRKGKPSLEDEVDAVLPTWSAGGTAGLFSLAPFSSWRETGAYLDKKFGHRAGFEACRIIGQTYAVGGYLSAAYIAYNIVQ